jgi:hypothetical protein
MWYPRTRLVGAANLLSSIAKIMKAKGVTMDYAFWDDGCDIPRPFSISDAQRLAREGTPQVHDGEGVLKTSVGGGGTNIYSLADRLSPYKYPPELNDDGTVKKNNERQVKYTPEMKRKYRLTYGDKYDLIIIYSDFVFPSRYRIPSDEREIKRLFDRIKVSPRTLCCICCDEDGEKSYTPQSFKKMVTWIDYATWKREIEVYSCRETQ